MTAPAKPRMIDRHQGLAIQILHGKLGRPLPEIAHLTHEQAGDLIIALRADLEQIAGGS